MMDLDGPLDFELEDPLLASPVPAKKRKKKVIGLDDLLTDYYKEKNKLIEREVKRAKAREIYNSDEDEDSRVAELSECVEKCQEQIETISGEDEMDLWGVQVFGNQKTRPPLVYPTVGSCMLMRSFMENELNSLVELNDEKGKTLLDGLLVNGWLLKLVYACSSVEKSIATWTYNLMLYSSKEVLRTSACDFWCAILSSEKKIRIDWLPNYSELKMALQIYGFQLDTSSNFSCSTKMVDTDSDCAGPPQNIRAWIRYITACFQVRSAQSIFLILEAEELVGLIIWLFLDRQLLGLCLILKECMLSAISFFTDNKWSTSCKKIAKSLACRIPKDTNCLRIVESISGVDNRSKHLRSLLAFQILISFFNNKATDAEEILRLLISVNVKDKNCDFSKIYIYLVLTENWLSYHLVLEDKPMLRDMWCIFLRNCLCQITSTDLRSYASKVRSKASFLLQGTGDK